MTIELKPVDRDNFHTVIGLDVTGEQKTFVAPNVYSIAQSKVEPNCVPLAVYAGEDPVGFVMYTMDTDDAEYWIWRVMIDAKHQSRGYGRAAMELLLARIKADTAHHRVYISFEPENAWARALYESLGFVPDGRTIGGEIVYKLAY